MTAWQIFLGLVCFSIAFIILTYCVKARKGKAPLLSESYFALSEEEKKYFDKDAELKRITILYGLFGLFFIFVGIMILTVNKLFGFIAIGVLAIALVYSIIKLVQTRMKSKN